MCRRCWERFGSGKTSDPNDGQAGKEPAARVGYDFRPITAAELDKLDCQPEWLVPRLVVQKQPVVVGASKKSLKTTIGLDLTLSLGTGTPFLATFTVRRLCRVAFVSGESGDFTIKETARRICAAKGVKLAEANVLFDFELPKLALPGDMDKLKAGLEREQVEVLILDPLYLCLLTGQTDLKASNLFDMGPLLRGIAQTCLAVGCTPIRIHHTPKRMPAGEPIELDDLAFAGIAEFVR